jgi:hypothetical protein
MSKVAIILRGHSIRKGTANYNSIEVDFNCDRGSITSLKTNIIAPLKTLYDTVDVYCCPSNTGSEEYLIKELSPNVFYKECICENQLNNMIDALKSVPQETNSSKYDAVFITRFDLLYKKPITEWGITDDSCDLYYPFRHVWWDEAVPCYNVPDTFHWIDNKRDAYSKFVDVMNWANNEGSQWMFGTSLHSLYNMILKSNINISQCFMCDTIHATNTTTKDWWAINPFYAHSGRHYMFDDFTSSSFLK